MHKGERYVLPHALVQLVLAICFQKEPELIQAADVVTLCHNLEFMNIVRAVDCRSEGGWRLHGDDAEAMLAWSCALEDKLKKVDSKDVRLFTQTIRNAVEARIQP